MEKEVIYKSQKEIRREAFLSMMKRSIPDSIIQSGCKSLDICYMLSQTEADVDMIKDMVYDLKKAIEIRLRSKNQPWVDKKLERLISLYTSIINTIELQLRALSDDINFQFDWFLTNAKLDLRAGSLIDYEPNNEFRFEEDTVTPK